MSDFKFKRDLNNVKEVKWKGKIYNVRNARYNLVDLFKNGEFVVTIDIDQLKKTKEKEKKMTMKKKASFTSAQAEKAVKKVMTEKKKKKYVLLEDIVIKAGTVFYESGETTFHDHYEMHMAFGPNHVGNFLVEKEMLEKSDGDKTEEIEFQFTKLIE